MSTHTNETTNDSNITLNESVFENQGTVHSKISDILNCVGFFFAMAGVVLGSFVINIVRQLDDDKLRSRFSLLCVLVCDVILSFSNLTDVIYLFTLLDETLFQSLQCSFSYVNWVFSGLFSIALTLSLFCLAVDQVIAVFKPLYFRTSEGTPRKLVYSSVIVFPVVVTAILLIYWSFEVTTASGFGISCSILMKAVEKLLQYIVIIVVFLAVSTPFIYAVVLWKISRQRCVHSENPLENIQNRKLVVSFLLLSASYFLLWMPTLVYFSVCYYSGDGCWRQDNIDVSLILHIVFTCNYIVDPVTCAVRMEPIKQKIHSNLQSLLKE